MSSFRRRSSSSKAAKRSASLSAVSAAPTQAHNLKSCLSQKPKAESAPLNNPRRVSFHTVEIREYERVMTDHPAALGGPALGIGWQYEPVAQLELGTYEEQSPPRRNADEFRMPPNVRMAKLKEQNVSEASMNAAVRKSDVIQRQRRATIATMELEGAQVVLGSLTRKFKRFVKMAPTTKQEQELLWKNAQDDNKSNTESVESVDEKQPEQATLNKPEARISTDEQMPDAMTLDSDSTLDDDVDDEEDDDC